MAPNVPPTAVDFVVTVGVDDEDEDDDDVVRMEDDGEGDGTEQEGRDEAGQGQYVMDGVALDLEPKVVIEGLDTWVEGDGSMRLLDVDERRC